MDDKKLARFLAGELSGAEAAQVEEWMAMSPEHEAIVRSLREAWTSAKAPTRRWDAEVALRKVDERLLALEKVDECTRTPASSSRRQPREHYRTPKWTLRWTLSAVAAVIVLLVGVGVLVRQTGWSPSSSGGRLLTFETEPGERKAVDLPDGTRALLNVASELRVDGGFGRYERRVYLSGEAYFAVASDAGRPFVVQTDASVTRVLGTRFGVRGYPEDSRVEVVVEEGRVAFAPRQKARTAHDAKGAAFRRDTVLRPGEMGVLPLNGAETRIAVARVNTQEQLGWREGRLIFRDVQLPEVLIQLERWYRLELEVSDSVLAAQRLTSSFDLAAQTPGEVLGLIAHSLNATYTVDGRRVVFRRK